MDERKRKVDMGIGSQGNVFWLHVFAIINIKRKVQNIAKLTPAGSLQIPSFVVSDELLIRSFCTTLRRRGNDAVAEIRSCPTESELAATNVDRTCSSVRPLESPARIALAFVVARGYTAIPAKVRTKPTNTFAGIVSKHPVNGVNIYRSYSTYNDPQHPISHPLVLLQVYPSSSTAALTPPSRANVRRLWDETSGRLRDSRPRARSNHALGHGFVTIIAVASRRVTKCVVKARN